MPAPKAKKPERCSFKEDRARCVKDASVKVGGVAFCRAHARIVAEAAASPQVDVRTVMHKAVGTAADLLRDFIDGKPISRDKVARSIQDLGWEFGGAYAAYQPPLDDVPIDGHDVSGDPGQGQRRQRQRRHPWGYEPPDPEREARRQQLAKARATLGFGPQDVITTDTLKARHRELAKRNHPDRGGSVERMQAINAAVDVVQASL